MRAAAQVHLIYAARPHGRYRCDITSTCYRRRQDNRFSRPTFLLGRMSIFAVNDLFGRIARNSRLSPRVEAVGGVVNEKGAEGQTFRALSTSSAAPSGGQRSLGLLDDSSERAALVHREIGHDLPVEFDTGQLGAVDELRIAQPLGAHRGVDSLDPQRAEAALLHLAVAIGVLAGLLDS